MFSKALSCMLAAVTTGMSVRRTETAESRGRQPNKVQKKVKEKRLTAENSPKSEKHDATYLVGHLEPASSRGLGHGFVRSSCFGEQKNRRFNIGSGAELPSPSLP